MSTVIGLDYGERRVGVAAGAREIGVATGVDTIVFASRRELRTALGELLAEREPELFVVGYPRTLAGERGERCRAVEAFTRRLTGWFSLPVVLQDERLTTVEAERVRLAAGRRAEGDAGKGLVDMASAVLILQSWFDAQAAGSDRAGGADEARSAEGDVTR
jgi:putative Holliday junction resolvase